MARRTLPTPFGRLATPHGTPLHGTPQHGALRRGGRRRGPELRGDTSTRLRLLRRTPPRNLAHTVDETLRARSEPSARLALGSGHAARGRGLQDLLALVLVAAGLAVGWRLGGQLGSVALPLAALLAALGGGLLFRRRLVLVRVAAALAFAMTVTALAGWLTG